MGARVGVPGGGRGERCSGITRIVILPRQWTSGERVGKQGDRESGKVSLVLLRILFALSHTPSHLCQVHTQCARR